MIKSKTQPFCRWCGKPLRKHTDTHYFGENVEFYKNHRDRAIHHGEKPTSRAEAQRYVNEEIVSHHWSHLYENGELLPRARQFIRKVGLWDGESYDTVRGFFCSNDCAMDLGRAAAEHHDIVGKAYNDAIRKRAKGATTP